MAETKKKKRPFRFRALYEVQVKTAYGWGSAGNFSARTLTEALKSLDECATGIRCGDVRGHTKAHRVVRLQPVVLATRKPTLRWSEREQCYFPLRKAAAPTREPEGRER